MKRAILCVQDPHNHIPKLNDYSIMIINPDTVASRQQYLLDHSDYSLLITNDDIKTRDGKDYPNERLFWYTSGTTGDSKFCSFTQAQLDLQAQQICQDYSITANDRYVSIMPLWHAHGQGFYWAAQSSGCQMEFVGISNIKQLTNYEPTFITAIPDILKIAGQLKFNHLRYIRSASAAMPNQLYQYLKQKHQVPVIEAFGMTEALSHCFTNPLDGEQRMGTIGLPSGVQADIIDGELYIQGPSVFCSGWYGTGDLINRDEKGYYQILGRVKDQINIKGIKLNPLSLESQLKSAVPTVGECTIFGSNTVNCLYTGHCDTGTVSQFLTSLGRYCRPRLVQQVDTIPLSPSGKISRSWLNKKYL